MIQRIRTNEARIDLALLEVLDAVYVERNIGRAARRLGVSQPVVSGALTRLRLLLKDQLFTRRPGGVEPTELANLIAPALHRSLSEIHDTLQEAGTFVPEQSDRTFVISMSDSGELSFLPILHRHLATIAPNLRLRSVRVPLGELASALETNAVHIALGQLPDMGVEFERAHLFDQDYVLVTGAHHPLAGQAVTRELLAQFQFVLVGRFPGAEQLIEEQGLSSQIRLRVAHYLAVPMILSTSNLAVWLPRSLIGPLGLLGSYWATSVASLERHFSLSAVRHRRSARDPGAQWFWGQVIQSISEVFG
ncbi:putative HTH-type transcriptional activator NagR [Paraburkholderia caribensis]|uniref:LysR family transcriptional regulator n=1 Tax=Paraburkholderia caribensis TaxID=75105 RepID=UPI001CB0D918|nr:LysR family transcriptional regulator [Paraburkholderia caribensis]CAG9219615.1 putative HTH-type transcriptional activator NagR [Paraburkholderia caribensis]